MSIWNKILVGLISVAAMGFFYLAGRAFVTEKYSADLAKSKETKIRTVEKANAALRDGVAGDASQPGIRRVEVELHKLLADRRQVWEHCTPKIKLSDDRAAEITVSLAETPHGMTAKTLVYAFEEADVQHGALHGRISRFVRRAATSDACAVLQGNPSRGGSSNPQNRKLSGCFMRQCPKTATKSSPRSVTRRKLMLPADSLEEHLKEAGTVTFVRSGITAFCSMPSVKNTSC